MCVQPEPPPSLSSGLAWIGLCRNGARRSGDRSSRQVHYIEKDDWIEERCRRNGVDVQSSFPNLCKLERPKPSLNIVGLMSVKPGRLLTTLSVRTLELDALLRYHSRPGDAYALTVGRLFRMETPVAVHTLRRKWESKIGSDSVGCGRYCKVRIGAAGLVYLGDDVVHDARLADLDDVGACGTLLQARSVLEAFDVHGDRLHNVPVLMLPEPVANLALARAWRDLVFLGR